MPLVDGVQFPVTPKSWKNGTCSLFSLVFGANRGASSMHAADLTSNQHLRRESSCGSCRSARGNEFLHNTCSSYVGLYKCLKSRNNRNATKR